MFSCTIVIHISFICSAIYAVCLLSLHCATTSLICYCYNWTEENATTWRGGPHLLHVLLLPCLCLTVSVAAGHEPFIWSWHNGDWNRKKHAQGSSCYERQEVGRFEEGSQWCRQRGQFWQIEKTKDGGNAARELRKYRYVDIRGQNCPDFFARWFDLPLTLIIVVDCVCF